MKLSQNFTLKEMLASGTASRRGFTEQFNPPQNVIENLQALCTNVLQPLRDGIKAPITVTSGYRCERVNKAVKGAKQSQHLKGEAADISSNAGNALLFEYIRKHLEYDQIIWEYGNDTEPDWVHVSFSRTKNRKVALKAVKDAKGKTTFIRI